MVKVWIGANARLQTKIITTFQSTPIGGHSGIMATYHRLKKLFAWHGLKAAVENFVQQCQVCQQAKHENCKLPGLLVPLPIRKEAWQDISMDFIEVPVSNGCHSILVVVDRFTKFAHFIPLKHPYTAQHVASVFLDRVASIYGLPKTMVSDRDAIFTSQFWKVLFTKMKVPLLINTTYHPQTDGQTGRVN